jgi:membrane protein YdbS with pleckstrin-like domain
MTEIKKETIKVPKKFKKTGKSFLPKLTASNDVSFKAFPKSLNFNGKEEEEEVVLVVRSHWIFLVPKVLLAILLPILITVIYAVFPGIFNSFAMFFGILIAGAVISISILATAFLKWYYNVNIVTDQRVVDVDFHNIVSHTMSEAQLEKIEDISHSVLGIVSSIFDIGTVYIQTASATAEIEFQNIPRPSDVQDILSDLLELKQKGEI